MFIEKEDDGAWLRDMPMWVVDTLLCLPDWIESKNPDVQARLLPKAYEDHERDKEWRAALGESLEHLIATRTQIVKGDLQDLQLISPDIEPSDDPKDDQERLGTQTLFEVRIPGPHLSAWISTLQAGTHAIFILEGLTPEDVDHDFDQDVDSTLEPDKQVALIRLSILQEILVRLLDD